MFKGGDDNDDDDEEEEEFESGKVVEGASSTGFGGFNKLKKDGSPCKFNKKGGTGTGVSDTTTAAVKMTQDE